MGAQPRCRDETHAGRVLLPSLGQAPLGGMARRGLCAGALLGHAGRRQPGHPGTLSGRD